MTRTGIRPDQIRKQGRSDLNKVISERAAAKLDALIRSRNFSLRLMSELADEPEANLRNYLRKKPKTEMPVGVFIRLCRELKVSADELAQIEADFVAIKLHTAKLAGGRGRLVATEDEPKEIKFRREFIEGERKDPKQIGAMKLEGHSMRGVIENGDVVAFDQADTAIREGAVFVIRVGGHAGDEPELTCKYVRRTENGFEAFGTDWKPGDEPTYRWSKNETKCQIVGRVFWRGGKLGWH